MLRQLPPTITADQTPDWLPAGWTVHSTALKRGRQTRTYTQLTSGKKFSTKDQVLEYIKMEKIREKRESDIKKRKLKASRDRVAEKERPSWLPDDWEMEHRIGSYGGNPYAMYVNKSTGFKTHLKEKVLSLHNTINHTQDSSSAAKERPSWLPDDWEMEQMIDSYGGTPYTMFVHKSTGFRTPLKEAVFRYVNNMDSLSGSEEDEEAMCNEIAYMIDESEEDLSEDEYFDKNVATFPTSTRSQPERTQKLDSRAITRCVFEDEEMNSDDEEENASREGRVVEEDKKLHEVVVECDDKAKGLTGTFSIEINVEQEPAKDGLVEKDLNKSETQGKGTRNIEIINLDSDSDSSKIVEAKNKKSKESLKKEDNINIGLSNPCAEEKENIDSSKKQKRNKKKKSEEEPCSSTSKNIKKKKDIKEPTQKSKGKRPQREKESPSLVMEEEKETIDWPKPNPKFPFEPITNRFRFLEDDSVIREYLEQNFTADITLPLPDFGLSSFANVVISKVEEEEEYGSNKKKSCLDPHPPPPCVQVASSSLPSCSYMQHTVAGN